MRAMFTRINADELAIAMEAEAAQVFSITPSDELSVWSCALCASWDSYGRDIKQHLLNEYVPLALNLPRTLPD